MSACEGDALHRMSIEWRVFLAGPTFGEPILRPRRMFIRRVSDTIGATQITFARPLRNTDE